MKMIGRVLTGPTASGKSALALELARKKGWDIVCMDSMQIYRGLEIGTAKPTLAERKLVRHHMLDILDPWESYSVSQYREQAENLVRKLWQEEHREVLFVGGTGLYLQAMMHPMGMGQVPPNARRRAELWDLADQTGGREQLHHLLEELDPATADRLPVNDLKRVIRAIEVTEATGVPFSKQPSREMSSEFDWRVVSTPLPREGLYERINRRVDEMIRTGLADEVRGLLSQGVTETAQSMAGLGYKEMIPYLRGEQTLSETVEAIQLGTRHYAKRQMTFLRREPAVQYVDVLEKNAEKVLEDFLTGTAATERTKKELAKHIGTW